MWFRQGAQVVAGCGLGRGARVIAGCGLVRELSVYVHIMSCD